MRERDFESYTTYFFASLVCMSIVERRRAWSMHVSELRGRICEPLSNFGLMALCEACVCFFGAGLARFGWLVGFCWLAIGTEVVGLGEVVSVEGVGFAGKGVNVYFGRWRVVVEHHLRDAIAIGAHQP